MARQVDVFAPEPAFYFVEAASLKLDVAADAFAYVADAHDHHPGLVFEAVEQGDEAAESGVTELVGLVEDDEGPLVGLLLKVSHYLIQQVVVGAASEERDAEGAGETAHELAFVPLVAFEVIHVLPVRCDECLRPAGFTGPGPVAYGEPEALLFRIRHDLMHGTGVGGLHDLPAVRTPVEDGGDFPPHAVPHLVEFARDDLGNGCVANVAFYGEPGLRAEALAFFAGEVGNLAEVHFVDVDGRTHCSVFNL